MKVTKNNQVIMVGTRNKEDNLYDIPVGKISLQRDNFLPSKTHPALYIQPNKKITENSIIPNARIIMKHGRKKLNKELKNMARLAEHNALDQAIGEYKNMDDRQEKIVTKLKEKQSLNVIIRKKQTKIDLVRYLHACCFSPVISTWLKAIENKHFTTWPGLTTDLVKKHLQQSSATVQGHTKRERLGLQSTTTPRQSHDKELEEVRKKYIFLKSKQKANETLKDVLNKDILEDAFPPSPTPNVKTNEVAYAVIDPDTLSNAYFDLTGRFPQRSSQGNQYIMIGYHYDANSIIAQPMKDRSATSMVMAWSKLHNIYETAAVAPHIYIMDNEFSAELKTALNQKNVKYQLVPPHSHRNNLAERAIQTFKSHFKAGLATCDPNFPVSEWDRLIYQSNLTLNLLRASRANPNLSSWAYLFGAFDFNATPLAPPGTKIIAHKDSATKGTWDLNGESGWYVAPAMDHYRCITGYFPRSRRTRICDTVTFFPHTIPFPEVRVDDYLRQAATDILDILTNPPSTTLPTLQAGDETRNALLKIATQLKRTDSITAPTQNLSSPSHEASSPRVVHKTETAKLPRVQTPINNNPQQTNIKPKPVPHPKQHQHLSEPINHKRNVNHRYNLRSTTTPRSYKARAAEYLVAQQLFEEYQHQVNHIYNIDGKRQTIDTVCKGPDKDVWNQSLSNEWGRLAQGNDNGVHFNDVIDFISQQEVPHGRDVTYATYVLDYRPLKEQKHRIRITVGGDRLSYPDDAGSPAANMLETKILINSVISDARKGARFMSADIKDFFLNSPMLRPEYMKVSYAHIPADIKEKYNLATKVTPSGHIYIKIKKGMYGLKQAAILAYQHLKSTLEPQGYYHVPGTIGMWAHKSRPIQFCLTVDDFGIKYFNKADVEHLLQTIGQLYKYTTDWTGQHYCGMKLDWNYKQGYVDVSMPGYVTMTLQRLQYTPKTPQYSPHRHTQFKYAKKGQRQYAKEPDNSPPLTPKETVWIQSVAGSFLYYARTIDYTLLPALNELSRDQSKPTEATRLKAQQIMDYAATYPNTYVRYHASDMILHVDSDAAYLVQPQAKSRIAGYYQLNNLPQAPTQHPVNGAILVECKTLRHVVASAAEAETAGVFHNAQTAVPLRIILQALGHPQPPTPIKTDNSTTNGFIHNNIHLKKSKSWDMRYHWLRDRATQQQFKFYWDTGDNNHGDYYTKHHPTCHHRSTRSTYVQDKLNIIVQRLTRLENRCTARVC